jgi:hypothetical protein
MSFDGPMITFTDYWSIGDLTNPHTIGVGLPIGGIESVGSKLLSGLGSKLAGVAERLLGGAGKEIGTAGQRLAPGSAASAEKLLANPILHDHHLLPQQFRGFFSKLGINVDEYTVTVSESTHLQGIHGSGIGTLPGRWNQQWATWIEANPGAAAKDVYQQLGRMMDDFGLSVKGIHPYGQ